LTLIDHLCITGAGTDRPTVTVPFAGELDTTRQAELLNAVIELDLPASTIVRLEMSRVTSIDRDGLRGMLAARAYLEGRGCVLELLRPNPELRRLLDITGLRELLTVVDERA
jgi:anti-anti-sigma factor